MKRCKMVMYHYVRPIKNSKFTKIKGLEINDFIKQIDYFKKNYHFITADELLDCIYKSRSISPKSILLTFDDGFKDHYQYVFPILKKERIQGLFFPSEKPILENIVLNVHKIHFILVKVDNKKTIIKEIFNLINQEVKEYNIQSPEYYYSKLAKPSRFDTGDIIFIKRILQRDLPLPLRMKITSWLFEKFVTDDESSFSNQLYLSFDEIEEMKESGMYFGSHSYSHEWLSKLSENDLNIEIEKSCEFFKKIKQSEERLIMAYPYGNYDDRVIKKLKQKEFGVGLITEPGDAILTESNAFSLKRYDTNDFPQ